MRPFSPQPRLLSGLLTRLFSILAVATALTPHALAQSSPAPRSFSGAALSENFGSLPATGTGSVLPSGFGFVKSNGNTTYATGTGSDNVGNTYSFGMAGSSDRALGTLRSNSMSPTIGVFIRNDSAQTLTQFTVSYTGKQFRLGAVRNGDTTGVSDSLDFQYSTSATALDATTGFTDFDSLDFVSPITTGTVGAVAGSTPISATVDGILLAPGAILALRWNDFDVKSSDDGLAIDDFVFSASSDASATPTPLATATPVPTSATTGALINEFRAGGPGGDTDDFVEIYNQNNVPLNVTGWTLTNGGAVVGTVSTTTVIPAYARLLFTGSGYSLTSYASSNFALSGDVTLTGPLNLVNAAGTTVDTVNTGTLAAPTAPNASYSFVRRMDGAGGAAQTGGAFNTVDLASPAGPNTTDGTSNNVLRLGAPGPQNLASPIVANQYITFTLLSSVRAGADANGNGGTLTRRYAIGNPTGSGRTITALRFRTTALTAGAATTGIADVRLSSSTTTEAGITPLTVEAPATQPNGGLNASVVGTPAGGIAPGASATVEFVFNVVQKGTFKFVLNLEPVVTSGSTPAPTPTPTPTTTLPDDDNMLLGNPSGAVAVAASVATSSDKENLLVRHPGESIGYQKSIGEPRWVSWHLTQSDIGSSGRTDNFRADTALPTDCQITSSNYTGSGFDRGHQCPSGDRTASVALNDDTFFMSNMQPQTAALNQRVWATLEDYCRSQVKAGQECYIMSGGIGSSGTIAGGKVNVPASCWKVVVILPKGTSDISRITKSTRVISVIMPNTTTITGSYTGYYSTVDAIESATGLDLLSNLPDDIENYLEASTTNR